MATPHQQHLPHPTRPSRQQSRHSHRLLVGHRARNLPALRRRRRPARLRRPATLHALHNQHRRNAKRHARPHCREWRPRHLRANRRDTARAGRAAGASRCARVRPPGHHGQQRRHRHRGAAARLGLTRRAVGPHARDQRQRRVSRHQVRREADDIARRARLRRQRLDHQRRVGAGSHWRGVVDGVLRCQSCRCEYDESGGDGLRAASDSCQCICAGDDGDGNDDAAF